MESAATDLVNTLKKASSAPLLGAVPPGVTPGPSGHREETPPWGPAAGIFTIPPPTLANGMHNFQTLYVFRSPDQLQFSGASSGQSCAGWSPAPPSLNFPRFDGENPRMWKSLCEQYFSMYSIHPSYWISMATLHFTSSTTIWLQSVHKKITHLDWEGFCNLLCTRFGRDRHQSLIRQFYTLRQTSSVADYIERFENLMNHLISYSDAIHPLYFLARFVEGLRADIRAVVMVQRPPDLDSACALSLLQEEVAEGVPKDHQRLPEFRCPQNASKVGVPLPLPPPRTTVPAVAEDRRGTDASRAGQDSGKLATLRVYRRARGFCFKCGERWGAITHAQLPSSYTWLKS